MPLRAVWRGWPIQVPAKKKENTLTWTAGRKKDEERVGKKRGRRGEKRTKRERERGEKRKEERDGEKGKRRGMRREV